MSNPGNTSSGLHQTRIFGHVGDSSRCDQGLTFSTPMWTQAGNIQTGGDLMKNPGIHRFPAVLEITEQPAKIFRFRYKSENKRANDTHGGMRGGSSTNTNKTWPTVRLSNYAGPYQDVRILASLYTEDTRKRHVHSLVGKDCKGGICVLPLSQDMTCSFRHLGVLLTKISDVQKVLYERKIHACLGPTTDADMLRCHDEANQESKTLDRHNVKICFEALNHSGQWIAPPVFSETVRNENILKISRMSSWASSCEGGQEVYLLCEKVKKKDIEVRFFQREGDKIVWSDVGRFVPSDVHKQFAICFVTPPYKDRQIENPVEVSIELYRPSDGETSIEGKFKYFPPERDADHYERKRRRYKEPNDNEMMDFSYIQNTSAFRQQIQIPSGTETFQAHQTGTSDTSYKELPSQTKSQDNQWPELLPELNIESPSIMSELRCCDVGAMSDDLPSLSVWSEPVEHVVYPFAWSETTSTTTTQLQENIPTFQPFSNTSTNLSGSTNANPLPAPGSRRTNPPTMFSFSTPTRRLGPTNPPRTNPQTAFSSAATTSLPSFSTLRDANFYLQTSPHACAIELTRPPKYDFVSHSASVSHDIGLDSFEFDGAASQKVVFPEVDGIDEKFGSLSLSCSALPDVKSPVRQSDHVISRQLVNSDTTMKDDLSSLTVELKMKGHKSRSNDDLSRSTGESTKKHKSRSKDYLNPSTDESETTKKHKSRSKDDLNRSTDESGATTKKHKYRSKDDLSRSTDESGATTKKHKSRSKDDLSRSTDESGTKTKKHKHLSKDVTSRCTEMTEKLIKKQKPQRKNDSSRLLVNEPETLIIGSMQQTTEPDGQTEAGRMVTEDSDLVSLKDKSLEDLTGPIIEHFVKSQLIPRMGLTLQLFTKTGKFQYLLWPLKDLLVFQNEDGDNALHLAVIHQAHNKLLFEHLMPIVMSLSSNNVLNHTNNSYQTPLHLAVEVEEGDAVKCLLENGADANVQDRNGNTPIHLAVMKKNAPCLRTLLEKDNYKIKCPDQPYPNYNILNYSEGYSPLHLCVQMGTASCLTLLLNAGADVDVQAPTSGRTPLHLAVELQSSLLEELAEHSSLQVLDFAGHTALDLALSMDSFRMIQTLKQKDEDLKLKSQDSEKIGPGAGVSLFFR